MDSKPRIIKAALRIFLQKGYNATSMNEVVVASHISKGGIYHHFQNKKDLYMQCIDFVFTRFREWEEQVYRNSSRIDEILQAYFGALCMINDFIRELSGDDEISINSLYTLLMETFLKFPELKEKHAVSHQSNMTILIRYLQDAQQNGIIKPEIDCDTVAFLVNALSEGTLLYHVLNEPIDLKTTGQKLYETIWNGIVSQN